RLVGVRPARPEPADRQMHETRIQGLECRIGEAELRESPDPEVLDDHVTAAQQRPQDVAALRPAEIEPEAALVAIDGEVVCGGPAAGRLRGDPWPAPAA